MSEKLDLRAADLFRQIKAKYDDSGSQYANILVQGVHGTGKTQLYATCPKPVLIHSFDPGGTQTAALQPFIESGEILVERFDDDDWKSPTCYRTWEKRFMALRDAGIFEHIGTYGLDSATSLVVYLMHHMMAIGEPQKSVKPHAGTTPYQSDYLQQQLHMANILRRDIMPLPCHTLTTAHVHLEKDELSGEIHTTLLMWGKIAEQFPLVFDEKYAMVVDRHGKHKLLVKSDGYYNCETRMGGDNFETYMEPDIRALLKKAGKSHEDKPKPPEEAPA